MAVEELAPAKVNLSLHVAGRRPDGYHELDSIVVFGAPRDRLTFEEADNLALEVRGPFADDVPQSPDNLILRAARRLAECADGGAPGARIVLDKRIPVAAGLGGGSADAAAALRGLSRLWGLALAAPEMAALALGLGADVPACLHGGPARLRGIGERIDPLRDHPALPLVLVNPRRSLATAAVFAGLGAIQPRVSAAPPSGADRAGWIDWLSAQGNDLERAAQHLVPEIRAVLAALRARPGCRLARMSGSGATCYGLFDDPSALVTAERALAAAHPGWWVTIGTEGDAR